MDRTAMIQVLGAISYGEWKAHEGAMAKAAAATSPAERQTWRKIAAEELRHHKGFVRCLRTLDADPERAMRPYRESLDRYHGAREGNAVEEAVWSFMGEGVADDLLRWLRRVVDGDTAAFIDSVLADEVEHEAHAADQLRGLLDADPRGRAAAARAARRMVTRMLAAGGPAPVRFSAFLRLGRPHELLGELVGGQVRRLRKIGVDPLRVVLLRA
ncbi:MAG: ferritin-like fold-containing protein [Acidimicrobiales bacterium]